MEQNRRTASQGKRIGLAGVTLGLVLSGFYCSTAPTPFVVRGPGSSENDPPTLSIVTPNANATLGQGDRFLIQWTDSDRDSNAEISFFFVNTRTENQLLLVQGISENDASGADSVTIGTSAVPLGAYYLLGVIDDLENSPVQVFAMTTTTATPQRVVLNVVASGSQPPTQPPVITVTQPQFDLSVAEEDTLTITIQPTPILPGDNTPPYDPDSEVRIYVLLDTDSDPNNDDPANPPPPGTENPAIIVLQQSTQALGNNQAVTFNIPVDLRTIPPRPGGAPYFIRATADDQTNPRVHQYASGKISVVELASGFVDLFDVGRTIAGAKFYGFSPGAQTGSTASTIGDFDADGVADFMLVAKLGNPRNFGLVGEAYLVYGLDGRRFGGAISVNTISENVSGVIFEAPPVRLSPNDIFIPTPTPARSDGISSVSFVPDLTGDGRPELLFGLEHVHSAVDTMDYDITDETIETGEDTEVALEISQGRTSITEGDGAAVIFPGYGGLTDTTISSATPTTAQGSAAGVFWRDDAGANVREWGLIKFTDVIFEFPDLADLFLIDSASIDAQLQLRVFETGGGANLHRAFTDFSEQTTLNTFGDGGAPVAGVDYEEVALGPINGAVADTITIDISDYVRQLVDGILIPENNELRFIIVPANDAVNPAGVRSSEFNTVANRPTLIINYTRLNVLGSLGCYPDPFVNNFTEQFELPLTDLYFYGGGMAVILNSQNRDEDGVINIARLESTSIALELVGAASTTPPLDGSGVNRVSGGIVPRASNAFAEPRGNDTNEPGRIAGSRVIGGGFDFIDHDFLRQGPREDMFGKTVSSIGDLDNDGLPEILISAPRSERYQQDLLDAFGFQSTQYNSTAFRASIVVIPGTNYNGLQWRDKNEEGGSTSALPFYSRAFGSCVPPEARAFFVPSDEFGVFAEDIDDMLGGASSAGDFNLDGIDDILCGAPLNDRGSNLEDSGAAYVLYGRNVLGDFRLENANNVLLRPPMLRVRGVKPNDQVGWKQSAGLDVNGDRLNDIFIGAPRVDFGGITRASCGGDFDRDGDVDANDFSSTNFESCLTRFRRADQELFSDDACKVYDYDNDGDLDQADETVVNCLRDGMANCCANLVDNGFVGVIFGGIFTDGDRDITQIATSDLPGAIFYGSNAGDQAGFDISSAGDFNQDSFGDLLIAVPGETRIDGAGRPRLGVVYLVFGGTHLTNTEWNLSQVGSADLPGIVFLSPYVKGRPNEAAPESVSFLGDVNRDGFGDIMVGNPRADFIDLSFPQGPNAPSGDAAVGRRRNAGDGYLIYGNNFGSNRGN